MNRTQEECCEDSCAGFPGAAEAVKAAKLDEDTVEGLSELFKAMGDPTRIKLIYALTQGECCVHDLTVALGMGQSAVSHQLRYLRNLRIVKRRKAGKTVYYSLDDDHVEQLLQLSLQHLKHG